MTIIIEGAGEVGSHLAKMLSSEANDITVIDAERRGLRNWAAARTWSPFPETCHPSMF